MSLDEESLIYGVHAVGEALRAGGRRIEHVSIARGRGDARVQGVIDLCREQRVPVRFVEREAIERMAPRGAVHQGILAIVGHAEYLDIEELLRRKKGARHFLVVLDGIEDPHNLGALLRSADASGADGVVIPDRRAVGVNATVVKSSAGASEYVPVAKAMNLGRAVDELKERNIWIVGLDERGDKSYEEMDFTSDVAIVLGAEGSGLHELIRKRCDFLIRIPMLGKVASLNVSVAGGVVMCEVARQRRTGSISERAKPAAKSKERKGLGS